MDSRKQVRIQRSSPIHLLLLADNSGSMQRLSPGSTTETVASVVTRSVQNWIAELQEKAKFRNAYFYFTLIVFERSARTLFEAEPVNGIESESLVLRGVDKAPTNFTAAFDEARRVLAADPIQTTNPPFVFLYSDGQATDRDTAVAAADALKSLQLPNGKPTLVTVGFGDADDELMTAIASLSEPTSAKPHPTALYKRVASPSELLDLLPRIGTPQKDNYHEQIVEALRS